MTEKIRKPIGKRKKLPQFTIMNVIEGQAGLENYSSLFFYSLTIDNILNIIVLLILAGIALNLTIGQNGIFSRAQTATNTWRNAETNEQLAMGELEDWMDGYMNGNGGNQGGGDQGDEVIVDTVKIPKGFYYVGGTKDAGLVISDNPADENKYSSSNWTDQANIPSGLNAETGTNGQIEPIVGNQFVWVPVEDSSKFQTYDGYAYGKIQSEFFSEIGQSGLYNFENCSELAPEGSRYEAEESEYNSMKTSVETNKGFYVARFEASEGTGSKAESKPGVEPWRYIAWGNSMTEIGTEGAVAKSQNMYTDKNTYGVTSTLIYGAQWDAIMNWLDPKYSTATAEDPCDANSIVVKSEYGNHSGDIANSVAYEDDKLKNIYDLCGNLYEWTMEAYSSDRRVVRGGCFFSSGSEDPVSRRFSFYPDYDDGNSSLGFRPALYL